MLEHGLESSVLMNIEQIHRMQSDFDSLAQTLWDDGSVEFWFARDLQEPLGYARWENFMTAIQRAIESCETTGYKSEHHFRGVTKMVSLGCGAERRVEDFMLTRKRVTKHRLTERYQSVTLPHAPCPMPRCHRHESSRTSTPGLVRVGHPYSQKGPAKSNPLVPPGAAGLATIWNALRRLFLARQNALTTRYLGRASHRHDSPNPTLRKTPEARWSMDFSPLIHWVVRNPFTPRSASLRTRSPSISFRFTST